MLTALVTLTLLLLTIAVVALFAMMGELGARVGAQGAGTSTGMGDWATEEPNLDDAIEPQWWPQPLDSLRHRPYGLIVVLSSSCQSCSQFLAGDLEVLAEYSPTYVVSCPSKDRADMFLQSHPVLNNRPVYVDVMGDWAREQLDVDVSPSAVLLAEGRPVGKFTMSAPVPLLEKIKITIATRGGVNT